MPIPGGPEPESRLSSPSTQSPSLRSEAEARSQEWKPRPVLAWLIRAVVVVVPLFVSWLAVRAAMGLVDRPAGTGPTLAWLAGAVALSAVVFQLVRWPIRRFSALGVLFTLSLTFPDAAPSRTRAFLRSGDDAGDALVGIIGADGDQSHRSKRLAALVTSVSRREAGSGRHGDRVRGYVELIAEELGLPDEEIEQLRWGALLHDVGLLDVPARILEGRGGLSAADRAVVEQHPVHAIGHLAPFGDWLGPAAGAATEHHERWDGTGYPSGLAGEEISLAGRIVAVADAYDAMTASRSYQKPRSPSAARRELVEHAGTQFDPAIVRAFLNAGIHERRMALGVVGALVEAPRQLLAAVASAGAGGAGAGATTAVATSLAVVATAVVGPVISAESDVPVGGAPVVDVARIVEPVVETTTTTTQPPPTTTAAPTLTTTTTTTTSTTTTTVPPATTTLPPPTTVTPTTTAPPPTTTATPTTTTTVAAYPTVPPPTTPPEYPSV